MERKRIGIYYMWAKYWMGGIYYTQNLMKALNVLDDHEKPFIDVYCDSEESYKELKKNTDYPYISMYIIKLSFIKKVYRELVYKICGDNAGASVDLFKILPDDMLIYPYCFGSENKKLVYWKQDFQEKFFPDYFSSKVLYKRDRMIRTTSERKIPIVFSSYDSLNAYKKFYPEYDTKTFVLHFAVSHIDFSDTDINEVKKKYNIKEDYFLCANQFWKHKNHLMLFKAYHEARKKGLKYQLVCTGKMLDWRNPKYIEEINQYIEDNNLSDNIKICGLVETKELYCLMKNAHAIIQPSLFEGWNTTVEDCKAMNKFVFLSDLPVHREQMNMNVCFFNPYDFNDLANKLLTILPETKVVDYRHNLKQFGKDFLNVINYVTEPQI